MAHHLAHRLVPTTLVSTHGVICAQILRAARRTPRRPHLDVIPLDITPTPTLTRRAGYHPAAAPQHEPGTAQRGVTVRVRLTLRLRLRLRARFRLRLRLRVSPNPNPNPSPEQVQPSAAWDLPQQYMPLGGAGPGLGLPQQPPPPPPQQAQQQQQQAQALADGGDRGGHQWRGDDQRTEPAWGDNQRNEPWSPSAPAGMDDARAELQQVVRVRVRGRGRVRP